MNRFLCQLCNTIVHYGEKHPCFFYSNDEDFNILLPLHESEEADINHDGVTEESHEVNMNGSSEKITSNIRKRNAERSLKNISQTTRSNEQISSLPTAKSKRESPSFLAGTSNNTDLKSSRDGSLLDSTAEIQVYEGNPRGNNATLRILWNSEQTFESPTTTASPLGKTELSQFEVSTDLVDTGISAGAASDSLSCKGITKNSIKKLHEFMEDAAAVAGPSVIHPRLPTLAKKRKYACDLCPKQFKNNTGLVRHYRTHTGEKPFKCDICGRGFTRKDTRDDHYRLHTGERPYECDICGQKFIQKSHLAEHYRKHTGEKPFACVTCNKSFGTRRELQQHAQSHTEVRPFICGVCGMAFKRNAERNRHHREKHPLN